MSESSFELKTLSQYAFTLRELGNSFYRTAIRSRECRTCSCWHPGAQNQEVGECRFVPPRPVPYSQLVKNEAGAVIEIKHDVQAGCPNTSKNHYCQHWRRWRPLFGIWGSKW